LLQRRSGAMLVASWGILYEIDGNAWREIDRAGWMVRGLHEDSDGTLWYVGDGLVRHRGGATTRFPMPASLLVGAMIRARDGRQRGAKRPDSVSSRIRPVTTPIAMSRFWKTGMGGSGPVAHMACSGMPMAGRPSSPKRTACEVPT
jgi:hypothetical protein